MRNYQLSMKMNWYIFLFINHVDDNDSTMVHEMVCCNVGNPLYYICFRLSYCF